MSREDERSAEGERVRKMFASHCVRDKFLTEIPLDLQDIHCCRKIRGLLEKYVNARSYNVNEHFYILMMLHKLKQRLTEILAKSEDVDCINTAPS